MSARSYPTPIAKLVFRKTEDPLVLEYGMEHSPGTFTSTGLRDHHLNPVETWCQENNCGALRTWPYHILFNSEAEVAWFLLAWG